MKRTTTFEDLQEILTKHSVRLLERLKVREANLSIPTDGQGLRIKVSVHPGTKGSEKRERVDFELDDGSIVEVRLEVVEDFQEYRPQ